MKAKSFTIFAAVIVATMITGQASAQKYGRRNVFGEGNLRPTVSRKPLQRAVPLRWAPIDKFGNQIGPWISMVGDNDWPNGPWTTVFDCIELSPVTGTAPNGAPWENPAYGPTYGLGNLRYWYGATYDLSFCTNDMEINPLYAGFDTNRVGIMWNWNPVAGPGTESCIINLNHAETFANTAAGLPPVAGPFNVSWSGAFDGVALDFGATLAVGGYFANINLDTGSTPLVMPLPIDGKGAYIMSIRNGPTTLASRAAPFLHMTKQTNHGLPGGNPSVNGPLQWDDDVFPGTLVNDSDGRHMTDPPGLTGEVELYDYTGSVPTIPEPLGAAYGAYSNFGAFAPASDSDVFVDSGLYFGGNAASLRVAGDNDPYYVLNDFDNNNGILRVFVDTAATTTTAMSVIGSTAASRSDITEFWQFRNNSTNTWQNVGSRTAPFGPFLSKRIDVTTGAANFLNATGGIQFRYLWVPQTDIDSGDGWTQTVDRLTIFVKGTAN